ncbi:ABC transporter B family member 11-like isoform X1 [Spinacia oleracea]|uniref:ABC transporter B family member 11-like isoform X1 n=1 Tax=Spinacia oleracea TaxID=3562 RepID=A0A9R0HSV7_SPIOL|nr:ABC transporter B family member 11-like isoform X1 [Spinacia oleracea]
MNKMLNATTYVLHVFFALTMAAIGISQSSSFAPDSSKAKSVAASVFSILDRKSKIDPSDESGMILDDVKGETELRYLRFSYPTRPDIQIFRDLRLSFVEQQLDESTQQAFHPKHLVHRNCVDYGKQEQSCFLHHKPIPIERI